MYVNVSSEMLRKFLDFSRQTPQMVAWLSAWLLGLPRGMVTLPTYSEGNWGSQARLGVLHPQFASWAVFWIPQPPQGILTNLSVLVTLPRDCDHLCGFESTTSTQSICVIAHSLKQQFMKNRRTLMFFWRIFIFTYSDMAHQCFLGQH